MEGENSQSNIPMQLISPNFFGNSGNDVLHGPGDDENGNLLMGTGGRSWNQTESLRLPWWVQVQVQSQETSHNYVQFLAETSAFLQGTPSEDMLESLPLPDNATPYTVSRVSEFQRGLSYNHLGLDCGSNSTDMDAWKLRALMPRNEDMENNYTSTQHHIQAQNLTSLTKNSNEDSYNAQVDIPSARVASTGSLSQPQSSVPKRRNYANERQCRARTAERLNALQELLPNSTKGCQVSILDDVIDHVKYLQLQIKDLCKSRLEGCKSRLEGELPTKPIIFREGYGHYFCDQEMSNEPLEEMMVKLLELNPLAAMELLEMKGLLLMPIKLTEGLD